MTYSHFKPKICLCKAYIRDGPQTNFPSTRPLVGRTVPSNGDFTSKSKGGQELSMTVRNEVLSLCKSLYTTIP